MGLFPSKNGTNSLDEVIDGAQNDLFPGKCACAYFRDRENAHVDIPQWLRYFKRKTNGHSLGDEKRQKWKYSFLLRERGRWRFFEIILYYNFK